MEEDWAAIVRKNEENLNIKRQEELAKQVFQVFLSNSLLQYVNHVNLKNQLTCYLINN